MAHASVASLMRTVESLLTSNFPMQSPICDHREDFCTLREKLSSMEVFLKNFEKNNVSGEMTDFKVQIKEVADIVEHTIQLRVTEVVLANDENLREKAYERLSDSLQHVAEDIDRIWKESTKIQDEGKQASKESLVQDFSSSTNDFLNVKNNMVGRGDQRKQLLKDLTRSYSGGEPKVIPIVGMGGIGKTTIAKEVYNDVSIRSHFDVRAWATVSQQHNVTEILLSLLRCIKDGKYGMYDEAELADMLQKSLKGKRYLIVLDDIWSSKAWDDVRQCFPSQDNESRILVTTRNNEVACYADTENLSLQMGLMDRDESWILFKSAAFANEALPSKFETIGKEIAEKCHGLPLTIVVVAGLLKSKRTIEDWEIVAKDVKSFVTNDPDEQCLHVLGLSYNHLTSNLKTCLLYFGIFPEDTEIPVKKLMRLWMTEWFHNSEKDLEGEAEKCLQELINRCLVLVSKKNVDETKIRSCKVHDLIHDLCLREAQRGNILIMNDIVFDKKTDAKEAQLIFHDPYFEHGTLDEIRYRALLTPGHHQLTDGDKNNSFKRTRSLFFSGNFFSDFILKSDLIHFKFLKILDLSHLRVDSFPLQILSLIWLRYLSLCVSESFEMPSEICWLWNLQTFIVRGFCSLTFPEQIWGLIQLRHLKLDSAVYLPTVSVDKGRLSNVQTISYLSPRCCTKEVISGIQNVKRLGIGGSQNDFESFRESGLFHNLVHLQQLETLSLRVSSFWNSSTLPAAIPSAKFFPATVNKLKLEETNLSWSYLNIIAELPNLEVLKLKSNACSGKIWNPNVAVFTRLKSLLIHSNYLEYWKATNDNFPVLERLVISCCLYLDRIPIEFADIYTLKLIKLRGFNSKLMASVARIQQEQEDLGNKPVDVRIMNSD